MAKTKQAFDENQQLSFQVRCMQNSIGTPALSKAIVQ